ncbi:MAG: acetate/propionate family kinase [Phycisphaerae bacterium]|nr:acetate/propionate family kinase [Phycisphaerae bacterium]
MLILIANPGSTSYKSKLFETDGMKCLYQCSVERIGDKQGIVTYTFNDGQAITVEPVIEDYHSAIKITLDILQQQFPVDSIAAVGFKVVIAKDVSGCVELTEDVLDAMNEYMVMAPVHTQVYLTAIEIFRDLMPDTPMIGLFETAFHSAITQEKYLYGIPYEFYRKYGIRKYGFHGASHRYIAHRIAEQYNGGDSNCRIISCHLGGSSSVCAIKNGVSIDTSMGMSPQSGLLNAKRVGDLDPFALLYLMEKENLSIAQTREVLSDKSGVLGISGISGDFRDIEDAMLAGDLQARAAFNTFAYYAKRYVGEYLATLNSTDFIVFTAGLGQNSPLMRKTILDNMGNLNIILDDEKNNLNPSEGLISTDDSPVKIAVIPTNEEWVVLQAVTQYLQ